MKSDKEIYYKNRGVERNKKPLKNRLYKFEVGQLKEGLSEERVKEMEQYKFKDQGYIVMLWSMQGWDYWNWHGYVTTKEVKKYIGDSQWGKFCQGKREFIVQRRVDGHNISKNETQKDQEEV